MWREIIMTLNYAILLEFLNDQNVQGQEIAEWLNTAPETISRIKKNNKNMIKGITPEETEEDQEGIAQISGTDESAKTEEFVNAIPDEEEEAENEKSTEADNKTTVATEANVEKKTDTQVQSETDADHKSEE